MDEFYNELTNLFIEQHLIRILKLYHEIDKLILIKNDQVNIINIKDVTFTDTFKIANCSNLACVINDDLVYVTIGYINKLNLLTKNLKQIPINYQHYSIWQIKKHQNIVFITFCHKQDHKYECPIYIYNPANDNIQTIKNELSISTFYENYIISCEGVDKLKKLDIVTEEITQINIPFKSKAYCVHQNAIILRYSRINIMFVNIDTGRMIKEIKNAHSLRIYDIIIHNDKLISVCCERVKVWNLNTLAPLFKIDVCSYGILAFDNTLIVKSENYIVQYFMNSYEKKILYNCDFNNHSLMMLLE